MLRQIGFVGTALFAMAGAVPAWCQDKAVAEFTTTGRIVAIGDVHGDMGQFLAVLRGAGVVDKKNKWALGKGHLIQTGDIPDRGPDTRKVLELLMDLEKQAKKAGGMVHSLIGNHEAMNLYGDLRYVIPAEYESFRTAQSADIRAQLFEVQKEELRKKATAEGKATDDDSLKRAFEAEVPLGFYEHRQAFGPKGDYGKWIRGHNTVVKVNDLLFLHGGISPKYATTTIPGFNDTVRAELADFTKLPGGMTIDTEGPLWYRGLAQNPEEALAAHVDSLLALHGVKTIVLGHTPTAGAVLPRFGGKVILNDVGLSKAYGGPPACLVVENGKRMAMHRGKMLDLPSDPAGLIPYLKAAAALDPQPSPLQKLIERGSAADAVKDDK